MHERYIAMNREMVLLSSYPRIGIFNGEGASHSWLWFVEILDRMGFYAVEFVDERDIKEDALSFLDVLMISGGDTFALAGGLGSKGSERIRGFIEEGGLYIGTCAGAYLPLRSSMSPLNQFNFVDMKISNISRKVSGFKPLQRRFCTPYGCDLIFHAVRGDVQLRMVHENGVDEKREFIAPLYGGPSLLHSDDVEAIAYYKGFTEKTEFFMDEEMAKETMIGNIAVARKSMGNGSLYIFGPHFEHPDYPLCNSFIADLLYGADGKGAIRAKRKDYDSSRELLKGKASKALLGDLKRELSNSRIAASAWADQVSFSWRIGEKYYGVEKIAFFVNFIWDKFRYLERIPDLEIDGEKILQCIEISKSVRKGILEIRSGIRENRDTTRQASELFSSLKVLCSTFLSEYFKTKQNKFCMGNPGGSN